MGIKYHPLHGAHVEGLAAEIAPKADLEKIQKAGLDRLHIGLETGDAALLKKIKKGATPEDHVKGGQKAMNAAFQVSEYVLIMQMKGKQLSAKMIRMSQQTGVLK